MAGTLREGSCNSNRARILEGLKCSAESRLTAVDNGAWLTINQEIWVLGKSPVVGWRTEEKVEDKNRKSGESRNGKTQFFYVTDLNAFLSEVKEVTRK